MAVPRPGYGQPAPAVSRKKYMRRKRKYPMKKPSMKRIQKDLTLLKSLVNPEKKRIQFNVTDQNVAQTNANTNGYYAIDITPNPSQSATSGGRVGNSIKLHASYLRFQWQSVAASVPDYKIKVMVVQVLGQPFASPGTALQTMLEPNPFVTGASIYDFYSDRDPENFTQFKILRSKTYTLKSNQITNVASIQTASFGVRYKHLNVKFTSDGSTAVANGQVLLFVLVNNGNLNGSTATTLNGTVLTAVNTGLLMQHDITHFYYDS